MTPVSPAITTPSSHPSALRVDPANTFRTDVHPILEAVQASLVAVFEAVSPRPKRVTELQRALDLDNHMSWSVFNLVHSPDLYNIATLLPGERALGKFLDRALDNGVPEAIVKDARRAIADFEGAVKVHAGSREMFEAMVAGLASENESLENEIDAKNRKAAFKTASILWRRQTQQRISCVIARPGAALGLVDRVMITGLVGVRQNRPGLPLRLQGSFLRSPTPSAPVAVQSEPLEPHADADGHPTLLRGFCSQPLPMIHRVTDEHGNVGYECVPRTLGTLGETTFFLGEIQRQLIAPPGSSSRTDLSHAIVFGGPVEFSLVDMFIHKDLWNERLPDVSVYAISAMDGSKEFRESDRLPMREKVNYMGRGLTGARTPEVARHAELLEYAFSRAGWDARDFGLFRSRIEYPLLHTRIRFTFGGQSSEHQ